MNNISFLYQRAHALRMKDKARGAEEAPAEFYVGVALGECVPDITYINSGIRHQAHRVYIVRTAFRRFAYNLEALHCELFYRLCWPENWRQIWRSLLITYGGKPRLLLAIADGLEA